MQSSVISRGPEFQLREAHNRGWSWTACEGLCKQMEICNRADAQRCDYLFQQFLVRYGDLESCIDTAAALLYQTFRLHKKNSRWIGPEQRSRFHIIDHVWNQKILENFLNHRPNAAALLVENKALNRGWLLSWQRKPFWT